MRTILNFNLENTLVQHAIKQILYQHRHDESANSAVHQIETQFGHLNGINNLIADCMRTQADILDDRKNKINDFNLTTKQINTMQPHVYYIQFANHDQIQGFDDQIYPCDRPTIQIIDFETLKSLLNHYLTTDQF